MLRYLVWHVPTPGTKTPAFYADADMIPVALRIYAERAPDVDMYVDVLDDGVSIMKSNNSTQWDFVNEPASIKFSSPSGTFTVQETITGGSSAATAKVRLNTLGNLTLYDVSGVFTSGETITGGSSSATGTVGTFVRQKQSAASTIVPGRSRAVLPKGTNSDAIADNFAQDVTIREGSWVTLAIPEDGGANNVTVQLEVNVLAESDEYRRT